MCSDSKGAVSFGFKYRNEADDIIEIMESLKAKILDIPYDIIIGRPTILKHNLLHKLSTHFFQRPTVKTGGISTQSGDLSTHDVPKLLRQPLVSEDHPAINILYRKDELITPEYDDDGIDLKVTDYPWEKDDPVPGSNIAKPEPHIEGGPELQARIRQLLAEFDDIFSTDVRPYPAQISPLEVNVDREKWNKPRNRLPPRTQTPAKNAEIERQIRKMVDLKSLNHHNHHTTVKFN